MTVLSTLCSWDISFMICGPGLYQPHPHPLGLLVCLLQCRRLFHHGEASLLKTEQTFDASLAFLEQFLPSRLLLVLQCFLYLAGPLL